MFTVLVGSKNQAAGLVKAHLATHWISLLDRGDRQFYISGQFANCQRLFLNCDDVLKPDIYGAPTREQVQQILDFTKNITQGTVVVNCFAGISRSTASALAILAQHHNCIDTAVKDLLAVRPQACPNPVISQYADEILEFNGKLFEASETIAKSRLLKYWT